MKIIFLIKFLTTKYNLKKQNAQSVFDHKRSNANVQITLETEKFGFKNPSSECSKQYCMANLYSLYVINHLRAYKCKSLNKLTYLLIDSM